MPGRLTAGANEVRQDASGGPCDPCAWRSPEVGLAKTAGLEIGQRGGIRVDENMRTSNPDNFAVGDAVEVRDFVTGEWSLIALAGPANRLGRIAADVIAGRDSRFRGTQGTSIIGVFAATIAWTGTSEKTLQRLGDADYEKIYFYPNSHADYYPGAKPFAMKVLFRKSSGLLLGAQAFGEDNVDKRISALAVAIQMGAKIYDLEEVELCYAPQFGSAKDPVNFAGMIAADILRGDMPLAHWNAADGTFLLDVREPKGVWGLAPTTLRPCPDRGKATLQRSQLARSVRTRRSQRTCACVDIPNARTGRSCWFPFSLCGNRTRERNGQKTFGRDSDRTVIHLPAET